MKKAMLRFTSGLSLDLVLVFAIIGIGFWQTITFQPIVVKNQPPITKVMDVSEKEPEIVETKILTDEELSKLYTCQDDIGEDSTIELTIEDAQRLMKVAVLEDSTDALSQAYVMSVIMNRVASPEFPDSIQGVIEEEGQFSTRNAYKSAEPDVNSHLALAMIESGEVKTDFLFFEATWIEDTWQAKHRSPSLVYGGTRFYQ